MCNSSAGQRASGAVEFVEELADFRAHRAVGTKRASPADAILSYVNGVADRTVQNRGDSSRPDGRKLPTGPNVFVFSLQGHQRQVRRSDLRVQLKAYVKEKLSYFGDPSIYLGTWLKGEDYVLDLSLPCMGLLPALLAGVVNGQDAIYHPASDSSIAVLPAQEISFVLAAQCCQPQVDIETNLASLHASLLALTQRDVYGLAVALVEQIRSVESRNLADEFVERLKAVRDLAEPISKSYAGLVQVCITHAKRRQAHDARAGACQELVVVG